MQSLSYKPKLFFSGTLLFTYCVQLLAAYMSYHTQFIFLLFPLILIGMSGPSIMAFILLKTAKNKNLWNDFYQRLRLNNIKTYFVPLIIAFWPCLMVLAIAFSLLFGFSTDQFLMFQGSLDSALTKISFLGLCSVVLLSCSLEEIGWRGYGIESLNNTTIYSTVH